MFTATLLESGQEHFCMGDSKEPRLSRGLWGAYIFIPIGKDFFYVYLYIFELNYKI